jgi:hypothetical protein
MDILTQAEIVLREAQYETWPWSGGPVPAICFEDQTLVGFLHTSPSAESLLKGWEKAQESALGRHAVALRSAGNKAWNVYSVFLAERGTAELNWRTERIEEDFSLARKIARANIQTNADLVRALLPLLRIRAQPTLGEAHYSDRVRARLKDVPASAVTAFVGAASAADVAHILETEP